MTLNGKPYTQPFEVWRDVTLPSTDADLAASTDLQRKIVDAMNESPTRSTASRSCGCRSRICARSTAANAALDKALAGIYQRMYDTELHYLSRTEMHSDDKWYVEKYKLYFNLIWLLAEVGGGGGDVMGGAGYAPTTAALAVFEDRVKDAQAAHRVHGPDAGSRGVQQDARRPAAGDQSGALSTTQGHVACGHDPGLSSQLSALS